MSCDTEKVLRMAKSFELCVRWLWPIARVALGGSVAKRCRNCAASEAFVKIGPDGLCEPCKSYMPTPRLQNSFALLDAFDNTIDDAVGDASGAYDALALFSGGKDSCYMIARMREDHPNLRILALSVDNTFMSPAALENIDVMLGSLDVDHIAIRSRRRFVKSLFSMAMRNLNQDGCYGTVDFSDGEFILDSARRIAHANGIPLILCGYSRYQIQNGLKFDSFESPREREAAPRAEVAGIPLKEIFKDPRDLKLWWGGAEKPPRMLFPLYAWDMPEDVIRAKVSKLGLIRKGYDSPLVTNHSLMPLFSVVDLQRSGYFSFEPEFSRMIREGKARRGDWLGAFELLEYCAKTGLFIKRAVEDGLAELGLTQDDLSIKLWR